jgi:hypothetical protein
MFEALHAIVHIILMAKSEFQCEVEHLNYIPGPAIIIAQKIPKKTSHSKVFSPKSTNLFRIILC